MKKILSLVLVLVLALGSFSFATPADVVGTNYATAVDRLMSLNLLTGYPDGTFKPEATITRAEFAAVLVRALGLESAATVNSATRYSDVPATHWASGYISVATGLGVINGHTDGTFRPSAPVTYEQAVAMVVRTLGYEPAVASKGGYPFGHLVIASENGVLDGINGVVGQPAPRGMVAIMVDNALEVPMMVQVGYGDEVKYIISGLDEDTEEQTLLANKLGLKVIKEKFVTDVDSDFTEFEIENLVLKAAPGVTVTGLEDLQVTVWYKESTMTAYVVKVHSTVYYDYVDVNTDTVITLWNAGKDIKAVTDLEVTVDGVDAIELEEDGNGGDGNLAGAFGKFILNKDGKLASATLYNNLNTQGIIKSVTETQLKYTKDDAAIVTISKMDDADYALIVVDGKAATYADLKADMFMEYKKLDDEYIIVANSGKIEGTYKSMRADTGKVTIGDKTYSTSWLSYEGTVYYSEDAMDTIEAAGSSADAEALEGAAVVAYNDNMGYVWLLSATVDSGTTTFYGFIKQVNLFNDQVKITRAVDNSVKTVTYTYDLADIAAADAAAYLDATELEAAFDTFTYGADSTVGIADYFKFTINKDNEITKIAVQTTVNNTVDATEVSKTNNTFLGTAPTSRYYAKDDLLIFDVVQQAGDDANTVRLVSYSSFENASLTGVEFFANGTTLKYMVIEGGNGVGDSTDYILAYAPTAPTLAAGKYTATVKMATGDVTITVDDSDIGDWSNSRRALILIKDGEEYVVSATKRSTSGAGFVTTAGLDTLDNSAFNDVYGVVTVKDGSYITVGSTYKVASDAIIYLQEDATTYSVADLSYLEEGDKVVFIEEDGIVRLMFFIDADAE